MAGRIREEDIEAVRERTDIVKLVSGYLTLRRPDTTRSSGSARSTPRRRRRSRSRRRKDVYYCFGCGAGGDAIRFLREVEHLEFAEAVERLAQGGGRHPALRGRHARRAPGRRRRRQALHRANEEAARAVPPHAARGPARARRPARTSSRAGIDRDAAAEFGIGYAPGYPDFLLRRLAKTLSPELLVEAGLAIQDQRGQRPRPVPRPDHVPGPRPLGPGGRDRRADPARRPTTRVRSTSTRPRRPSTARARSSTTCTARRRAVTKPGEVFVVEGYTDVIALVRAGVENAVATCGTALGEGHFRLASRFAQRMVLAFDSDEAGRARRRARVRVPRAVPRPAGRADPARGPGPGRLRRTSTAARPSASSRRAARPAGRVHAPADRRAATTCPRSRARARRSRRRSRCSRASATRSARASTRTCSPSSPACPRARSCSRSSAGWLGTPGRGRSRPSSAPRRRRRSSARCSGSSRATPRRLPAARAAAHRRALPVGAATASCFATLLATPTAMSRGLRSPTSEDEKVVARALGARARAARRRADRRSTREDVWARLQEFRLKRRSAELRQRLQKLNPTTDPRVRRAVPAS